MGGDAALAGAARVTCTGRLVLQAGLPTVVLACSLMPLGLHPFARGAPSSPWAGDSPRGPQHLRQPLSPFSPYFPTSHSASGSRCWLQEQGHIVQGCHAQVLGFPPSPHPPPFWGSVPGRVQAFHWHCSLLNYFFQFSPAFPIFQSLWGPALMSVPEQLTGLVMKRPGSTSHNFYYLKIFSTWWKKIQSTFPISRINKLAK